MKFVIFDGSQQTKNFPELATGKAIRVDSLIEELEELDPNAVIVISDGRGGYSPLMRECIGEEFETDNVETEPAYPTDDPGRW